MVELGAGFNIGLTGYENAVLYETLLGRDPAFVRSRLAHIWEWASLTKRHVHPVRSYSTGMLARLSGRPERRRVAFRRLLGQRGLLQGRLTPGEW